MAFRSTFDVLAELRDLLNTAGGFTTARIGIESDISPNDYPILRLVPESTRHSTQFPIKDCRETECLVYFGNAIAESDAGMESLQEELMALELRLISLLPTGVGAIVAYYKGTLFDEDRVPGFKLAALRVQVHG